MKILGFTVLVLAVLAALVSALAFVVMLALNVVLEHWGIKSADFSASLAIVVLSSILIGGTFANNKD